MGLEGSANWADMKASAAAAFKQQNFKRARDLYTEILNNYGEEMDVKESMVIRGNRCLASQKQGEFWAIAIWLHISQSAGCLEKREEEPPV